MDTGNCACVSFGVQQNIALNKLNAVFVYILQGAYFEPL